MMNIFGKICDKLYCNFVNNFDSNSGFIRFLNDNSLSSKLCNKCVRLPNYEDVNIFNVEKMWRNIFFDVCSYFGIGRKSAKFMWDEMCVHNNWEHLHPTKDELRKSSEELYNSFKSDVFYCSDRWSFDRLMRCQWQFNYWISTE